MRAVEQPNITGRSSHSPELNFTHVETIEPAYGQVTVDIAAAGINRADLLQARGLYPPPPGASTILGLEFSGIVSACGPGVTSFAPGDRVIGLTDSGAYSEQITIAADLLLRVPEPVSLIDAGGIMEAACTVWSNLYDRARLLPGQSVLIHGASGGVGSFAIQLASALGSTVLATARTPERADRCRALGAAHAFAYARPQGEPTFDNDLPQLVREVTHDGVDVILDVLGGQYLSANLHSLALGGRLVTIGTQRGARAELDLGLVMSRRLALHGTTLRSRPLEEKAEIVRAVGAHVLPLLASGQIVPVTHATFALEDASAAHALLDSGEVFGKVLLLP